MKKRNLLLLSFLFYFVSSNFGQNLIWSDKFTEYSDAKSILKTKDGKILIAGSLSTDSLFVALYDTDGRRLKRIKYLDHYNISLALVEQENGDFLLFTFSGKIWKINSSLDSVSVVTSTNFNILNSFYNNNEIIILGHKIKLVLNKNSFQINYSQLLSIDINKFAYLFSENKEYYFDIKDSIIALTINENAQQSVYQFNNIDSMYQISKTFLCENGDILLIGYRYEKVNTKVRCTIIYRVNQTGNLLWSQKFIYSNLESRYNAYKSLTSVSESKNGELMFTGTNGTSPIGPVSDILYIKLDSTGNLLSEKSLNFCFGGNHGNGIEELNNEIYIAATVCLSDFGGPDRAVLFKLDNTISKIDQYKSPSITISPNPSFGLLTIDFHQQKMQHAKLFSSLGNLVKSFDIENEDKLELQLSDLHSGIYFVQCTDINGRSSIKKWIKN
jgi:hypothetical protein